MKESRNMERKKNVLILVCAAIFLLRFVHAARIGPPSTGHPKHFVLVHGACLGAWSWYKLVPLLRSSGHNVTALDLAASGINPKQVLDIPSLSDYSQPLRDFVASLPPQQRVILVGHSYGGLAISQAMEMFPEKIAVAVFVTSPMPGPSLSISTLFAEIARRVGSQLDNVFTFDHGSPITFIFGPKYLATKVSQLSPIQDLALATLLIRPFHQYSVQDISKDLMLSKDKYGSVSRVFIISEQDKELTKDFQQWMIEKNPPNEVQEIRGSDHMVMMSKPLALVAHLLRISEKFFA